jgi:ubiquinone biosynthesis monooxygenase Coq7
MERRLCPRVTHSVSRWLWPDCIPAPVSGDTFLSYGGWLLGFLTALLGRQGIWACTAAVEAAVHRHLDEQLHFLKGHDPDFLSDIILSIRDEGIAHLRHAEERLVSRSVAFSVLRGIISLATDTLIWLSTWEIRRG